MMNTINTNIKIIIFVAVLALMAVSCGGDSPKSSSTTIIDPIKTTATYKIVNNSGKNVDIYIDDAAKRKYNNGCNGTKLMTIEAGKTVSKETNICGEVYNMCYQASNSIPSNRYQYSLGGRDIICGAIIDKTLSNTDSPASAILSFKSSTKNVRNIIVYKKGIDTKFLTLANSSITFNAGLTNFAKDVTTDISATNCHPTNEYGIAVQFDGTDDGFFNITGDAKNTNNTNPTKPWKKIVCGTKLTYTW